MCFCSGESMDAYQAIVSRRSIRRFHQRPVRLEILKKCVNAARLAPSAANLQPLEYCIVHEKTLCANLFEALHWAAYIQPKWTPKESERPTAYIIVLVKDTKNPYYERDVGLATENIILTAEGEGLGTCILCNIERVKIQEVCNIPLTLAIDSVIALGYKAETSVVEEMKDSVKYWRDEKETLHVPKRKLEDILHLNRFP
jgi:nitroreductase